uniref:Uncharacterized protein n=1 Tax=Siphoviridae sp. ctss15 TaxID=2825699 RepID=A0A8S5TRF4_9CAUD|nr:MAG TPA: hypothetical protein [Siphoviridae sp. ctss15]
MFIYITLTFPVSARLGCQKWVCRTRSNAVMLQGLGIEVVR